MIDLTPLDVRKKKRDFTKALRGYEPREVDQFLDTVAERLEEVVKLNLSLRERVELLTDRVSGQEGREKAVQEALISAQALKQDIESQAKREGDLLRLEAEAAAEDRRRDADTYAESVRGEADTYADTVKREADTYCETVTREADVQAEVIRREAESRAAELRREIESSSEGVRENVKRLLNDRRRELVELNRGRARFLKTFRTLLERELDAVDVAESNVPSAELDLDVLRFGRNPARTEEAIADAARDAAETVVAELAAESDKPAVAGEDHVVGAIPGHFAGSVPSDLPDPLPSGDATSGEERWGVR